MLFGVVNFFVLLEFSVLFDVVEKSVSFEWRKDVCYWIAAFCVFGCCYLFRPVHTLPQYNNMTATHCKMLEHTARNTHQRGNAVRVVGVIIDADDCIRRIKCIMI